MFYLHYLRLFLRGFHMQAYEYEELKKYVQEKKSSNSYALLLLLLMITLTLIMVLISSSQSGTIWFFAQLILGVLILQWFFLVHDLGHGHFFSWSKMNIICGVLASFFVMLPFFSWKYIHRYHHVWTGWKDKDPTMSMIVPTKIPIWQKRVINFCWKYWIPIFSLSFSFSNFWNLPKLIKLFPQKKNHFFFSIS